MSNVDFKPKLVAALRSGEFTQGRDCLLDGHKYCCLGVACVVAGYTIDEANDRAIRPDGTYDPQQSYGALEDCGLDNKARGHLIYMNDDGKSFAEIADYIEQKL